MAFNTGAALLDAITLAVVAQDKQGTYGYRITQQITNVLDLSESTLYPVLRRLQKDGCLHVRDEAVNGRNRRYYQVTDKGRGQMEAYREEWRAYTQKIDKLFWGDEP